MSRSLLTVTSLLASATLASAGDWPNYRGPDSNTVAPAGDYPLSLVSGKDEAWRIDLPGIGSASPITLGESIYLTCEVDGQDALCCYSGDGETRWERLLGPARRGKHANATGANSTPATDGERVYAYFKSGLLAAFTLAGEELWRVNLQKKFGKDTLWWDLGTSPVLTDAGVLIAVMQAGDSYLVTFDRRTGEVVWKTPRQFDCAKESDQSYTTPVLVDVAGEPTAIVFGADHLTGHDPATGADRFACGGFNPQREALWRVIASPTTSEGIAVVTHGRGELLSAVRLGGRGDITADALLWTRQGIGADVPSPIVRDGKIYQLGDRGQVDCLDLTSGRTLWSGKLPRSRTNYFATPLLAGEVMYCLREDGRGHVVRADASLEVLGEIDLGDDTVVTPIPFAGDRLLVRTRSRLTLFEKP